LDINDLRGLSTLALMIGFVGLCFWAYSRKRKKAFEDAANIPFADEDMNRETMEKEHRDG
jgi:cytochrome c oxidase cbb3-type subunit 4